MGSSYDEYMDDHENSRTVQQRFDPTTLSVIDKIDRMYHEKNMVSVGFWREVKPEIEALQEEARQLRTHQAGEACSACGGKGYTVKCDYTIPCDHPFAPVPEGYVMVPVELAHQLENL